MSSSKHSFKMNISSVARTFKNNLFSSDVKVEQLNSNKAALKDALIQCRKEIKKCKRWKVFPSPKYFEHAAMLSRQTKEYQNEIKICQLFITLVNDCSSRRTFNKKGITSKAELLCKPFSARLLNAKNLQEHTGVDVQHL